MIFINGIRLFNLCSKGERESIICRIDQVTNCDCLLDQQQLWTLVKRSELILHRQAGVAECFA
ncbi:hypothetical protein T02_6500 [Trichinella nativa]|uniref:Uncharacterized protein n=1 Tax=Trichinella nativa TaxID=6335 RepID=A0A0V1L121_9BILA|nr:hypothetical protein T02_6500 [Trichinella nativa]